MGYNLSPELGAHVIRLRLNAHPAEVQPVRIPACADGRLGAQPAVRVLGASLIQQFKMLVADVEKHPSQLRGIGRPLRPVSIIPTVMLFSASDFQRLLGNLLELNVVKYPAGLLFPLKISRGEGEDLRESLASFDG